MFDCVVCGVDATPESLVAARQAARLLAPGGSLHLVAAADVGAAAQAGFEAVYATDQVRDDAGEALARAQAAIPEQAAGHVVDGRAEAALLEVARRERATLVAIGAHRRSRAAELLLGSTALAVIRDASCSVLAARETDDSGRFPRAIVVGLDGSAEAQAAAEVASNVSKHCGGAITGVVATGGKDVDPEAATGQAFEVEVEADSPVDVLKRRGETADLLVVGSRGLHGVRALGSVSERVANGASCSVLVVR